jgi:hypothetical protein
MPLFFIYVRFSSPSYSYNTFIRRHSPRFLSLSSSLVRSVQKTFLGCRAENRTYACRTASRRTTYHLSYAAPFFSSELRRTLEPYTYLLVLLEAMSPVLHVEGLRTPLGSVVFGRRLSVAPFVFVAFHRCYEYML